MVRNNSLISSIEGVLPSSNKYKTYNLDHINFIKSIYFDSTDFVMFIFLFNCMPHLLNVMQIIQNKLSHLNIYC